MLKKKRQEKMWEIGYLERQQHKITLETAENECAATTTQRITAYLHFTIKDTGYFSNYHFYRANVYRVAWNSLENCNRVSILFPLLLLLVV